MNINTFFLFLLIIFSSSATNVLAQTEKKIEVLAKIRTVGNSIELIVPNEKETIPSLVQKKELEKIINSLIPGDEALVTGHIIYHAHSLEGQTSYRPIFIIEDIKPISLRLLGKMDLATTFESSYATLKPQDNFYPPIGIPVSTEVASAITMTSTLLLMHSLGSSSAQPQATQQMNAGLFLFAGALATGIFIYEQITAHSPQH